jgi:hypothetical protein
MSKLIGTNRCGPRWKGIPHRARAQGFAWWVTALHALPPTVSLPEGRKNVVRAIKLPLVVQLQR